MKNKTPYLAYALVCLVISAVFLLFYVQELWTEVDQAAFAWATAVRTDSVTLFFQAFTYFGAGFVMAPLAIIAAIAMLRKGYRVEALTLVLTVFVAALLNEGMKAYFARPRPEGFHVIALPSSYSYPSGHSMVGSVLYLILFDFIRFRLRQQKGAVLLRFAGILFALLLPVSRVYLGVHYASDVLTGFALALTLYFLARYGYGRWSGHRDKSTRAPIHVRP